MSLRIERRYDSNQVQVRDRRHEAVQENKRKEEKNNDKALEYPEDLIFSSAEPYCKSSLLVLNGPVHHKTLPKYLKDLWIHLFKKQKPPQK